MFAPSAHGLVLDPPPKFDEQTCRIPTLDCSRRHATTARSQTPSGLTKPARRQPNRRAVTGGEAAGGSPEAVGSERGRTGGSPAEGDEPPARRGRGGARQGGGDRRGRDGGCGGGGHEVAEGGGGDAVSQRGQRGVQGGGGLFVAAGLGLWKLKQERGARRARRGLAERTRKKGTRASG